MSNSSRSLRRRKAQPKFSFDKLEHRHLLAGVFFDSATGELTIFGDSGDNIATASVSGSSIRTNLAGNIRDFPASDVTSLVFIGFGGDDIYTNSTSIPSAMYGQAGNDTLNGGSGDDNLIGGVGNDVIRGNAGADRVVGASGNDELFGGAGNDRMFGTAGTNLIRGNDGDDVIFGGNEVDTIHGDNGIDQIFALGGDDILFSGLGGVPGSPGVAQADLILGHDGNDTITAGGGLDVFWGGNGNDTMTGATGESRFHGQNGNDTLTGGSGADFLRGLNDDDTINGGGGNDTIHGGAGNDIANGGAGNDIISMQAGTSDVVQFSATYDSATVAASNGGQTVTVTSGAGTDTVLTTERLSFSDREISSDQATLNATELGSLSRLNGHRTNQSRTTLSTPSDLAEFARNWSAQMVTRGLVHSSTASQLALLTNGRTTVGENIVFIPDNGQTVTAVLDEMQSLWQNSTIHNNNMLNTAFSEVGIGVVFGNGGWWGTHIFVG